MEVNTKEGTKKINRIYYTPNLKVNLLSVGQIMERKYKVVFEYGKCVIYDKNNGHRLVTIVSMINNRLFPLKFGGYFSQLANVAMEYKNWLWHMRYDHLSYLSLRLLTSQQMVHGLPNIEEENIVHE